MAPMTDRHRHYLLCPVCTKTQPSLSVHLRRACMRNATPEAIAAVVETAKKESCTLLMTGRVFSYVILRQILDDADPLSRLIEELQRRHMAVTGIPPPLPNANVLSTSSAGIVAPVATKNMTDGQKSLVADYLTHSTSTAEKHHRMKQPENVIRASQLLSLLAGDSSVESGQEETSRSARAALRDRFRQGSIDINEEYEKLLTIHPVTVEETVPVHFLKKYDRPARKILSGRWVKAQRRLRIQQVLVHYSRHPIQPSEHRVGAYVQKQGWETNVPKADEVIGKWKPPGAVDTLMDSRRIRKLVRKQSWKGLFVKDTTDKGKGVITTRTFQAGEVVCDYHGRVVTEAEGREIHASTSAEETGYMFFFKNKTTGKKMCIDAHRDCDCHPGVQTFGRLINHSRKRGNLRPRQDVMSGEDGEADVILFIASRDIGVGEELLFDYGVKKGSHGEGQDLDWL